MGIIKTGTVEIEGKKIEAKVFGYEKDGKFIVCETFLSEKDLINTGMWKHKTSWDDASKQEGVENV